MAIIFTINQNGVEYRAKLIDCISDASFDIDLIDEQFIIFYKPDGIRFSKDAIITPNLDDPIDSDIRYFNTSLIEDSILDLIGKWEYSAEVLLTSGDRFESQERSVFWVK